MKVAAVVAVGFLGLLTLFQLALALGAPLGRAAWGGQQGSVLPNRFRIASAFAGVVLYPAIIVCVLISAEVISPDWLPGPSKVVMWILTGFFGLGTLANFASRSKAERFWGPVSLVISVCCGIIASGI